MTRARRNHYVPQFYLRYFCLEGKLWVYTKGAGAPRAQTPINTAIQKDLYTIVGPDGKKSDLLEQALVTPSEGAAKPILDRLQDRRTYLQPSEKAPLARFMCLLHARVPRNIALVRAMGGLAVTEYMKALAEDRQRFHEMYERFAAQHDEPLMDEEEMRQAQLDLDKHFTVRMSDAASLAWSMSFADRIYPVITKMNWSICDAPGGEEFVTCDAPVVSFAPSGGGYAQFGVGFANPALEVTFPVTPTVCVFVHRRTRQGRWRCSTRFVSETNRRTVAMAHEQIFSRYRSRRLARMMDRYASGATESWIDPPAVRRLARASVEKERRRD